MRNSLNKSKPTKKMRGKTAKQKLTRRSANTTADNTTDNSSTSDTPSEIDFFSRPGAMPSHKRGSPRSSSSFDDSVGRPGPSNRSQRLSNANNNSIGRPGPSSQVRRNPTGVKAGSNAGPLSRVRPNAQSSPRRSNAPTPKPTAKKAPRKQAKPKKRRDHVLRQIRLLQDSVYYLIPLAPFHRIVREVMQRENTFGSHEDWRITGDALKALQSSAEAYIVNLMEDASYCAYHRNRVTLTNKDMVLVRMLRRDSDLSRRD